MDDLRAQKLTQSVSYICMVPISHVELSGNKKYRVNVTTQQCHQEM